MTEAAINPARQALIDKLKEIEKEKYASADAFAKALGVDPGHLSKVKRGLAPPGGKIYRGLLTKHPETECLVRDSWMNE